MLAIAALATSFWACGDDPKPSTDAPDVTAPASVTDVLIEDEVELTFTVAAKGGYGSAAVSAVGGTASITTQPTAGATSGNVVVTFIAGANEGAGSVTLTVTDGDTKTGSATAVLDITDVVTISSNITADATWETGKTYVLGGRIAVVDGVTLTIEPGVVVKGEAGTGSNATALLIARGATLMAEGTAAEPIIFTSVADELQPGEIESPNLDPTVNGLWGGLIILGRAPISVASDLETKSIEGIPADDPNGVYGGTDAADNSGTIRYVSIRHGGSNIGEGNEINGLTLGGVGSGTTIEYIEIVGNQDDGIEWFGGTVNVSNALVWYAGDDAIDTDQAWGGTLDNFIIISPSDKCFELDGGEGTTDATHFLTNGSVRASVTADGRQAASLVDFDSDSFSDLSSIYFFDLVSGQTVDSDPASSSVASLQATIPDGTTLATFFLAGTDAFTTEVAAGANTVGATVANFSNWTWASASGALSTF